MSILRRGGLVSTLAGLIGVSTVLGAGLASKQSPPPQQSSVLVDLSGSNMTGHGSTAGQGEIAAPIVDAASKKKKPAPSFWNRLVHPTQWFGSSKKK